MRKCLDACVVCGHMSGMGAEECPVQPAAICMDLYNDSYNPVISDTYNAIYPHSCMPMCATVRSWGTAHRRAPAIAGAGHRRHWPAALAIARGADRALPFSARLVVQVIVCVGHVSLTRHRCALLCCCVLLRAAVCFCALWPILHCCIAHLSLD